VEIAADFVFWNRKYKLGVCFDSSTCFKLPNGANRSPDVAWIKAHGLVVRSPFCDLLLAVWTFQLSGEFCLHGACEKYILKRAAENWLPAKIVWRQKRGMGVPLTSWCLNDYWHDIGNWLNPGILSSENCFFPDIASQIVTGQLGGQIQGRRIGESLWLLIMWQLWRYHVFGSKLGKKSLSHPFILPQWLWKKLQQSQI
jgi:asparagine synthase (glutamine-hydrolysing)